MGFDVSVRRPSRLVFFRLDIPERIWRKTYRTLRIMLQMNSDRPEIEGKMKSLVVRHVTRS
jgi:hypothetical protein